MSDPVTALGGARFDGLLSVSEDRQCGMITVRGDLASPAIARAASAANGLDMPANRTAIHAAGHGILWMSPDELLVLCPYKDVDITVASMISMLDDVHALVVDVSDARARFELQGNGVRDVLAKLTPADMSPQALPIGELRRTRLAQVPAAFWLESDTKAQVICFRSVAEYMFNLLKTAAQPGSAVNFF